ncbi:ATP-binding cassette subfamily B protein IrtB [Enterococcus sp. PF1-24]|uniref:ABC transporter ATP-binding protein n=1 Tax=unclassified Enterococcus TaxID=2608891 RepID=UPI0024766128|nr:MULTISPECIES: ABC transporter ATP-binding protein [unclassified Enterococcus]MDH6364100.1 ATP-binding cassette subfamily B protein IrtB [Enterococcus sp. PFB1-1]MDH6401201.1 ATP-binding cassette subfamily B protein IrtB [Enterococcus sp. PF1-24]
MIKMMKDILFVIGKQINLLIAPVCLAILDALLNMCFYSVMILGIVKLVENDFTQAFFTKSVIVLVVVFIARVLLVSHSYNSLQINGSKIITKLRIQLADHVRGLNSGFFNQNSIGKLTSNFTTDIADFEQVLTHNFSDIFKTLFMILFGLVAALIIDFRFAVIIVVMILIALPFLVAGGKTGTKAATRHRPKINAVISRVVEYINGIKTFKLYQLTGVKFKRLDDSFNDLRKSAIKTELSMMPFMMAFSTIVSFILPVALVWGTYLLLNETTTPTKFIAVLMLSISISSQLIALGMLYPEMKYMAKSAVNLRQVMSQQPLTYTKEELSAENYEIVLKDVNFAYENDVAVLKNINLRMPIKTTTALIGPSGSGKSTIIHLLARFWDVTSGAITFNQQNIAEVKPDALTSQISMVFQDVYLFNDTILNNIRIAKPEATQAEVIEACKAANCHQFIANLENGYDTMVGEGGSTLSGGEKQRSSIARALLKDAPIVLLDETTSNLDVDNEKEINQALDLLMKDKTVVVIAHRLNTIINADQIVVLDEGEIREQGNHQALLNNHDWYAQMYQEQEKARNWVV